LVDDRSLLGSDLDPFHVRHRHYDLLVELPR